jgi:tetratricopeptide (TPR) repeat protein
MLATITCGICTKRAFGFSSTNRERLPANAVHGGIITSPVQEGSAGILPLGSVESDPEDPVNKYIRETDKFLRINLYPAAQSVLKEEIQQHRSLDAESPPNGLYYLYIARALISLQHQQDLDKQDPFEEALDMAEIAVTKASPAHLRLVYMGLLNPFMEAYLASEPGIEATRRLQIFFRESVAFDANVSEQAGVRSFLYYILGRIGVRNYHNSDELDAAVDDFRLSDELAPTTEQVALKTERLFEYQNALFQAGLKREDRERLERALEVGRRSPGVSSDVVCELHGRCIRQHLSLIESLQRFHNVTADQEEVLQMVKKGLLRTGPEDPDREQIADMGFFLLHNTFDRLPDRSSRDALLNWVDTSIARGNESDVARGTLLKMSAILHTLVWKEENDSRSWAVALGHIGNIPTRAITNQPERTEFVNASRRVLLGFLEDSEPQTGDLDTLVEQYHKELPSPICLFDETSGQRDQDKVKGYIKALDKFYTQGLSVQHVEKGITSVIDFIAAAEATSTEIGRKVALELRILLNSRLFYLRNEPTFRDRCPRIADEALDIFSACQNRRDIGAREWHELGLQLQYLSEALPQARLAYEQSLIASRRDFASLRYMTMARLVEVYLLLVDMESALNTCAEGIEELGTLLDISLPLSDMEKQLTNIWTFGSTAFTLAILLHPRSLYRALELLDDGRGIIIGGLTGTRRDFEDLRREGMQEVVDRAQELRTRMWQNESPQDGPGPFALTTEQSLRIQRSREAAAEFRKLVNAVREMKGHDRFLRTPAEKDLMCAAAHGPIVLVNIHEFSSDAIIITSERIRHLHLADLRISHRWLGRSTEVEKEVEFDPLKLSCGHSERVSVNEKLWREHLPWLYKSAVLPILQDLGVHLPSESRRTEALPRIWWIGCGAANHLPFHAAGIYKKGRPVDTTMQHVISSYAPTLKALMHSRQHTKQLSDLKDGFKVVATAMVDTPGMDELTSARKELDRVSRMIEGSLGNANITESSYASEVRDLLPKAQIAYLACHGVSIPARPSQSHLALLRKPQTEDIWHEPPILDKLTLADLARNDLPNAAIAFLSACSTAQNRVEGLEDEVLHIASGFLVAGFRHVIASMWPVMDELSPDFGEVFWKTMMGKAVDQWEDRLVAEAVHNATLHVRNGLPKQPLAWAPYAHWGA